MKNIQELFNSGINLETDFIDKNYYLDKCFETGKIVTAEVQENGLVLLAILKSKKSSSFFYQIRLDWKAQDQVDVDHYILNERTEKTEKNNSDLDELGHHPKSESTGQVIFQLCFPSKNNYLFRGRLIIDQRKIRNIKQFSIGAILTKQENK